MVKHTLGCIALLVTCGCGRKIVEEPPRTVVQARVQPCTEHCEAQFSPCGPGPSEAFVTVEGCIEECTTVEGVFAQRWAYQPDTQTDACFDEVIAVMECMSEQFRQCVIDWHSVSVACSSYTFPLTQCTDRYHGGAP
jgi:hypothetical protein